MAAQRRPDRPAMGGPPRAGTPMRRVFLRPWSTVCACALTGTLPTSGRHGGFRCCVSFRLFQRGRPVHQLEGSVTGHSAVPQQRDQPYCEVGGTTDTREGMQLEESTEKKIGAGQVQQERSTVHSRKHNLQHKIGTLVPDVEMSRELRLPDSIGVHIQYREHEQVHDGESSGKDGLPRDPDEGFPVHDSPDVMHALLQPPAGCVEGKRSSAFRSPLLGSRVFPTLVLRWLMSFQREEQRRAAARLGLNRRQQRDRPNPRPLPRHVGSDRDPDTDSDSLLDLVTPSSRQAQARAGLPAVRRCGESVPRAILRARDGSGARHRSARDTSSHRRPRFQTGHAPQAARHTPCLKGR